MYTWAHRYPLNLPSYFFLQEATCNLLDKISKSYYMKSWDTLFGKPFMSKGIWHWTESNSWEVEVTL